ncbi:Inactive tyrosine-protein kinase transmembrane receptor ROR1 [Nymphon striatum]|nr:Inactive tyrosine-protein kinase transmembrane receptor ROR1 [Nymphon striatum]
METGEKTGLCSQDQCYKGKGEDYRGTVSRSVANLNCLPWSKGNLFKWSEYKELLGGHNYCRNPGDKKNRPWCFVENFTNPMVQLCNVDACVDFREFWLYILIPVMVAALIFGLIVFMLFMIYRVNIKEVKKVKQENEAAKIQKEKESCKSERPCSVNALEVPIANIKFCEELGEGAFGKVYKGYVLGFFSDIKATPVAVKTLKTNASYKVKQEFKREVELMSFLQHPNIICLLGVCINEQPMCMLFEFMSHGDLHEYLVTNFIHSDELSIDDYGEDFALTQASSCRLHLHDLLYISVQIAAGMEYLSSHHYVHRDLATRNCLVSENLVVKISDFGLSRDIYSSDYYRVQSKSLMPVRWMPPESILYGKFTSESDVWSFGILLWEIFSFGLQPYYGRSNQEVIDMIRSRQLLPVPTKLPTASLRTDVAELARAAFSEAFLQISLILKHKNSGDINFGDNSDQYVLAQAITALLRGHSQNHVTPGGSGPSVT